MRPLLPNVPDKQLTKCPDHKQAIPVFQVGPVTIYGGAGHDHTPAPAGGVVFDLAGMFKPVVTTTGFDIPGVSSRYVRIEWPDQGTPNLDAEDWQAIARAILAAGIPVMVACAGGHGRTGTALAVLGHYLEAFPSATTDPIDYLRRVYCPEAVESQKQVSYVKALTGRETTCKGSNAGVTYGKGTSYGSGTLCPDRVGGKFCNLDTGHAGPHDTRSRSEIDAEKDLAPKPKPKSIESLMSSSSATSCSTALGKYKGPKTPILFCPEPKCMLRVNHKGPCMDIEHKPIGG
jgi:hypothetical protein